MADNSTNNLVAIVAIFAIVIVACVVLYYVFGSEHVVSRNSTTPIAIAPGSTSSSPH